jgi:hypothetical protein
MVEQILSNNNEKCYTNFSTKFSQLNTAKAEEEARQPCVHVSIDLRSLHTTDKTYGVQSKL